MNVWVAASYMVYTLRQSTVVCGEVKVVYLLWKGLKIKVSSSSRKTVLPFPAILSTNLLIILFAVCGACS